MNLDWNIITPILSAIAGILSAPAWTWIIKYFHEKNISKSKLEIKKLERENKGQLDLEDKYQKLLEELADTKEKLQKVQLHLDKAIVAFEMLMPLLEENFKDNEPYLEIIRQAEIHIKKID